MNKTIITLLLSTSLNAFAFDFKGIEAGKVSSYEEVGNTLNIQCHDEPDNRVWCNGSVTIVGDKAEANVSLDSNKVVSSIYVKFNTSSFEKIAEALIAKYGKPKIRKSVLSNAMGAKFDQIKMSWSDKKSIMLLDRYNDKIDEGSLMIMTNDHLKELDKAIKKDKSDI